MLRRWLPVVMFTLAVLAMAGPWASTDSTASVAEPWLVRLGFPADLAYLAHRGLRKVGHFLAYAIFAWLTLRAVRGDRAPTRATAWTAFGIAVALAVSDEALQSLSPGRGGLLRDLAIDAAGAAVALFFLLRASRPRPAEPAQP